METTPNPELPVCTFCRKPLDGAQRVEHRGSLYCSECIGIALDREIVAKKGTQLRSPATAVILSFIPGLGQMYNRQMKRGALILVTFFLLPVLFGTSSQTGFLLAATMPALFFWNLFDAYWGARRINEAGLPKIPEPDYDDFSWADLHIESVMTPAFGVLLIVLGILFLLNNFDVITLTWDTIWPLALLGTGIWMLTGYVLSKRAEQAILSEVEESSND